MLKINSYIFIILTAKINKFCQKRNLLRFSHQFLQILKQYLFILKLKLLILQVWNNNFTMFVIMR